MEKTPKSLRLHIALFGRTNVGKSTFLNLLAGQDVAITSPEPGTTTDVVEKPMELLPVGPVLFLDTGGLDDKSVLGSERIRRAANTMRRADIVLLLCADNHFGKYEQQIIERARAGKLPVLAVINRKGNTAVDADFREKLRKNTAGVIECCAIDIAGRNRVTDELKALLLQVLPEEFRKPPQLLENLLPSRGLIVLIVPIDLEAPKGRLILPQVQTIRSALDNNAMVAVVKETEYKNLLKELKNPPALVVCDSQVVDFMVAATPPEVPCTTFSILFARLKSDLKTLLDGTEAISKLRSGDRVLIAESCSHHPLEDDIGRIKIPRWLREYTGAELHFDSCAGRDFPENLDAYRLIVQCGGCMNNRAEMLSRLSRAAESEIPITNYGLCISFAHGVLDRVIAPFKLNFANDQQERIS
ncbi:MAG: [FeFe] hydrogenase H-cluster maturation GTPase HydF [Victivallales bacterium]|nr:[FeFe] hydrogenase H-cluster maturation GTPase HydF [Victivallales bacterium]